MSALEADLQSEYNVDLRDLFRPGSGLTVRRVCVLLRELPLDSRIHRRMSSSKILSYKDHLTLDLLEGIRQVSYWAYVSAVKGVDEANQRALVRGAPKPLERPGQEKKKKTFVSGAQLANRLGGRAAAIPTRKAR